MSAHNDRKKIPSRSALTRQMTKGPLEAEENPISIASSIQSSNIVPSANASQLSLSPTTLAIEKQRSNPSPGPPIPASPLPEPAEPVSEDKDLSFVLEASIYHPLSQLEVPVPFRKPFLAAPTARVPIQQSLSDLDELLEKCEFLRAAQFAGSLLTGGYLRPNDTQTVFHLLAVRYACLELSGNLVLAAQEAKALEDLNSSFYYADKSEDVAIDRDPSQPPPKHIMPFNLRLQAVRLQSIGFSDPRRGVSALYELGFECRGHLSYPGTSVADRKLWSARLEEIGVRVVNALIELGDYECASRVLQSMKPSETRALSTWTGRMVLLLIKMGDVKQAMDIIETTSSSQSDRTIMRSLIQMANGDFEAAVKALTDQGNVDDELSSLAKQNLAVAYLYTGSLDKSRKLMEELVDKNHTFRTLTINLATLYELTSDSAKDLKAALVGKVAGEPNRLQQPRTFLNADFKL